MASARKPTTHRAFFGHRIDYVISHAKCPVAVVAASSTNGTKK
jgi:nucleotide-binding universal stress UspA family protein